MIKRLFCLLMIALPLMASAIEVVVDGIKYTLDETKMTAEAAGLEDSTITDLVIPASIKVEEKEYQVQSIGYMAFHMSHIKSLSLPEGLKSIGTGAFAVIYGIEEVKIPNSVETIGPVAFDGCIYVKTVVIGEGVKTIGESAFSGMGRLEKMYIYARQIPVTELRTGDMIEETGWNSMILYVPNDLVEEYRQSELPCWSEVRDKNILPLNSTEIVRPSYREIRSDVRYYLDGRRLKSPQKGINIIRQSDGTTKKVIVK